MPATELPRTAVPANARVERFVAHTPILERAACAITHGSAGATQKALAHGVPVCVVPFGRDQLEVARRAEVAGAGTRLPAQRLTAKRLIGKREGARRVADGFARAGGPVSASDALEELAARANTGSSALSHSAGNA
jgi:UDP:flavonoid glycosyltransferase YjiC (YdhE family)